MKKTIFLIPLLSIICTCSQIQSQIQNIEIIRDTININIKGEMIHSLVYDNKYYCFFSEKTPYRSSLKKKFYIFSPNGTIEHCMEVPKELYRGVYFDLHVRNDSILVKTYYDKNTYFLDRERYEWQQIQTTDDLIYEDDKFYVTSLDFGEWGGRTWFRDKATNNEYQIASTTPIVNKLNNVYYLTSGHTILKVDDPLKMKQCPPKYYYKDLAKERFSTEEDYSIKGAQLLFKDSAIYWPMSEFYIVTSFVIEDQLYHLCVNKGKTYVATLNNGEMIPILNIDDNINVFRYSNTYRCRILKDHSQSLRFNTESQYLFGIVQIKANKIYIHYFENEHPIKARPVGTNAADSLFSKRLKHMLSTIGDLKISEAIKFEQAIGSEDITPGHVVGIGTDYYPKAKKDKLDGFKSYWIVEDSVISNKTEYFYTKKDERVRAILFEWDEERDNRPFFFEEDMTLTKRFEDKFEKIKLYITNEIGDPITKEEKQKKYKNKDDGDIFWRTSDGVLVKLYGENFNKFCRFRMIIYKE